MTYAPDPRHRNELRRDRGRHRRRRPARSLAERGAVPARRAPALWRRGAGDRRPQPSGPSRPADRRDDEARPGSSFGDLDAIAATGGPGLIGGVIVGVMTGKAIAAVARQAVHRRQSPGGPCADRAADRRHRLSLSAAAGLRRPLPAADRRGRRPLSPARHHRRRRGRRGLRQGRQAAGPGLSRRARRWRRRRAAGNAARFDLPRPMLGREGCDFSFSGLKTALRHRVLDLASDRPTRRPGPRRSRRRAAGRHRRLPRRPHAQRHRARLRAAPADRQRWSWPAASPRTAPSARAARRSPRQPACGSSRRRRGSAPTMPP